MRRAVNSLVEFQEHLGGRLTIMLLRGVGAAFDVHEIQRDVMVRSIELLRTLSAVGPAEAGRHTRQ